MDMTSVKEASRVVDVVTKYAHNTAQLWYKSELFLSTFQDGTVDSVDFDWQWDVITPIESQLDGGYVKFVPGITSTDYQAAFSPSYVDGVFTWPHQSTPLSQDKQNDVAFQNTAAYTNKLWMAGIAPWFFVGSETFTPLTSKLIADYRDITQVRTGAICKIATSS